MPLSPAERAALREIERQLTVEGRAHRAGQGRSLRRGAPLLLAWVLFVLVLIASWVIWSNTAALVLALAWLVLLPALVLAYRQRHRLY
jgi:Flp pilus assembly protein TadB